MSLVTVVMSVANLIFGKPVVGGIIDTITGYFRRRQDSRLRIEEAKIEARIEQIRADSKMYGDADVESIKQWRYSYIDEVFKGTIIFLVVAPFIPELRAYVLEGAQALSNYPLWLQIIIVGTYMSVLGLRFLLHAPLRRIFVKRKEELRDGEN